MRNVVKAIAIAVICCMVYGGTTNAAQSDSVYADTEKEQTAEQDEIKINKTNFTTKKLRKWAKSLDKDQNGKLSLEEGSVVTEFKDEEKILDESPVVKTYSADFFSLLPNLEEVILDGVAVNKLDFSGNPKLKKISLTGCDVLEEINLSKNSDLTIFDCAICNFPTLDFSNCTELNDVTIGVHRLQQLIFSNNKKLTRIWCHGESTGQVRGLSNLPKVKEIHCQDTKMKTMEINNLPSLKDLDLVGGSIKSLKITNTNNLQNIDVSICKLRTLDVSTCKKLKTLDCDFNKLTELKVSGLKNLTMLSCQKNKITSLDVSGCKKLKKLNCRNNKMKKLVTSKNNMKECLYKAGNKGIKLVRK